MYVSGNLAQRFSVRDFLGGGPTLYPPDWKPPRFGYLCTILNTSFEVATGDGVTTYFSGYLESGYQLLPEDPGLEYFPNTEGSLNDWEPYNFYSYRGGDPIYASSMSLTMDGMYNCYWSCEFSDPPEEGEPVFLYISFVDSLFYCSEVVSFTFDPQEVQGKTLSDFSYINLYIDYLVPSSPTGSIIVNIRAVKETNPALLDENDPTTDFSSRTLTSASAYAEINSTGAHTVDIDNVIQELVNDVGWQLGNNLILYLEASTYGQFMGTDNDLSELRISCSEQDSDYVPPRGDNVVFFGNINYDDSPYEGEIILGGQEMAVKRPIVLYDGILKQIRPGDVTVGESEAASIGMRAESLARALSGEASSEAALRASEAASIAERSGSLARVADADASSARSLASIDYSLANLGIGRASEATSIGERSGSIARVGVGRASEATSIGMRAESLARIADSSADVAKSIALSIAENVDVSEAASYAYVADSVADLALERASEATSMAERAASLAREAVEASDISEAASIALRAQSIGRLAESFARVGDSVADLAELRASEAASIGTRAQSVANLAESFARAGDSVADLAELRASEATSIGLRVQSIAVLAESFARVGDSVADLALSEANRAESLARMAQSGYIEGLYREYSIANSVSGQPREGCLVYISGQNTVGLAKADAEATMPAFGVIVHDGGTKCVVFTSQGLRKNVKVDSNANVAGGEMVYVSPIQAGRVTDIPPSGNGHVIQVVGVAKTNQNAGVVDVTFMPGDIVVI